MATRITAIRIGQIVQLAGAAAFLVGIILSMQHAVIGAFFVIGAAAFLVGRKLSKG